MRVATSLAFAASLALVAPAAFADDAAVESLMKKSNCFKCHAVDKKKDGPSFKQSAEKYRGKPDAEAKLFTHLTTHPTVKIDGNEEKHESLKTTNEVEIREVIKWILAR